MRSPCRANGLRCSFVLTSLVTWITGVQGAGAAQFIDSFTTGLDATYWSTASNQPLYTLNDANGDLRLSKPAGGTIGSFQTINVEFRFDLRGDFDVSVAFRDARIDRLNGSPANQVQLNAIFGSQMFCVVRDDDIVGGDNRHVYIDPPRDWRGAQATTATAGTLRITRVGSMVTGYFGSTAIFSGSYNTSDVSRLWLSLQNNGTTDATSVTFDDFRVTAGAILGPVPTPGVAFTAIYDAAAGPLPDRGCLPWSLMDTAAPEDPASNGGTLLISTSEQSENISYAHSGILVPDPLVVEARVKFISGSSNSAARAPILLAITTAPEKGILFCVGDGEVFLTAAGTLVRGPAAAVPTGDDFHTYRVEIGSAGVASVFRDGVFVLAGSTYTNAPDHGPTPRILFGEGAEGSFGTSEWTSVQHNAGITIADQVPPLLTVPADVTATTGPGTQACANVSLLLEVGSATAADNCSEPTIAVDGLPMGSLFPAGETILTWTATDDAGNTATGSQRVTVSCPVGAVVGSASLHCNGQAVPAENVTVRLLHEGSPFRSTLTGPAGSYRFDDVRRGTYTVAIDAPAGFATAPDTRVVTLDQAEEPVESFDFTCLLSDLTGQVTGTCNGQTVGLQGVTVDVFRDDGQGADVLVATASTDANGDYRFDELALGDYTIGIVPPLGYTVDTASQEVTLVTPDGSLAALVFTLTCQATTAEPRGTGYWKHQVNVYLTGKGHAEETLSDLIHYIDEMVVHFNQNFVNPVIVYRPTSDTTQDKLLQLQQLLTVNRGGTALDRAKQALLALLLNVISGRTSQTEVICDNGATVSQAITHSHDLIVDGSSINDGDARAICELISSDQRVPDTLLPVGVREIAYKPPITNDGRLAVLGIERMHPNRAAEGIAVSLALPADGGATLAVFNVAGTRMWHQTLALGAGHHSVRIPEASRFATGVYMVVLRQAGSTATRRVVMVR